LNSGEPHEASLRYLNMQGGNAAAEKRTVWLSPGYRGRHPRQPAPPPILYAREGMSTRLHYSPVHGNAPDWLGEIFEWVSCADEYSVPARDRIGRPLYEATYAGRHGIDMRTPYAAIAMHALQKEICRVAPGAAAEPMPPDGLEGHAVIPSHDVDYFPLGRANMVNRLARNAIISCLSAKSPMLGLRQADLALRAALGAKADPLDRIVALANEERRVGFSASYYFLVRHGHRVDARYSLETPGVLEMMRWLESRGMEIGLHASFTSLDEARGLEDETGMMANRGFRPRGSRQHWLRFTMDRLLPAVERAGLAYDTSIGWATRTGFRAGACFAYPPYDFGKEGPANFLELPLVVMDQALQKPGIPGEQLYQEVAQMIAASRRLGWGGISLLWHPVAFGPGWLPPKIGKVFWRLAQDRMRWSDAWMPAAQFLQLARNRYVEAGLLPGASAPSGVIEINGPRRRKPSAAAARPKNKARRA
jgi:hypothetical protein